MNEIAQICREADALRARGVPFLLATVVRVAGSAYRRPGARMLVAEDRWVAGCVSGGGFERDVLLRGGFRTRSGAPVLVTYDGRSTEDGRDGRCDGLIDVFLERIDTSTTLEPTRFAGECIASERPGALVTVFECDDPSRPIGGRIAVRHEGLVASTIEDRRLRSELLAAATDVLRCERAGARTVVTCGVTALVERLAPPPHLFIVGTGHDVPPLAALARMIGFEVTVADTRAVPTMFAQRAIVATPEQLARLVDRRDRAAVVLMTHDYERDRDCLPALLASSARYLGVLGPSERTERMLAEHGLVLSGEQRMRLHAPVGLDLGAETPHEIAMAVLAEIQATLAHASAARLRDGRAPIHGGARPTAFLRSGTA